jgi:hypothetical protein
VNDELHAAALIEKPFGDDGSLFGHRAENSLPAQDVFDSLLGASRVQAAFLAKPGYRQEARG